MLPAVLHDVADSIEEAAVVRGDRAPHHCGPAPSWHFHAGRRRYNTVRNATDSEIIMGRPVADLQLQVRCAVTVTRTAAPGQLRCMQ